MLIEKTQFKDYVDFSDNINDRKLNYHISDAEIFDFAPLVPAEFYLAFKTLVAYNIAQWSRTTPYAINARCYSTVNQKKYIALRSTTGDEPSVSASDWSEIELATLFDEYVKPYLVYCAFARYLLWAGRHVAQGGLRTMNDDTSTEITDKARGELIADIENKKAYSWSLLKKKLDDDEYTYDGTQYTFSTDCDISRPKRNFKIRAV